LSERRRNTYLWLLPSLLGGSLLCSLLTVLGAPSLLGAAAAAVLAGIALALVLGGIRTGDLFTPDRRNTSGANMVKTCYEAGVRILHTARVSRTECLALLKGTAAVLTGCQRLKARINDIGPAPVGTGSGLLTAGATPQRGTDWATDSPGRSVTPMLQEVMSAVREMAGVLRDVDHNAKELITSTEETAYSMTRLDSFLQDMANSGRDLEASTDTANRVALEGTKVVEEMGRENEAILATVNEAASAVEDLGRWSQEVGKIVEVIRDIANETNLLALNASIIAAQSGEHGKAFGVVAEEIRGLAERTSSSTKEISDLVKAVQKNVANVVNGMKKSLQRVERGELLTRNAGTVLEKVFESFESSRNLAKQIASSTFEHKIDSSQVVRSLHKVTDIARRLQSHDYAGWTGAGETLGLARTLSVMSDWDRSRQRVLRPAGIEEHDHGGPGLAEPVESDEDGFRRLLAAVDLEVGRCVDSLRTMTDTLNSWLDAIDSVCRTVGAGLKAATAEWEIVDLGPCWKVAECDSDLRGRCPAYKAADRLLFFSQEAACMQQRVKAGAAALTDNAASPSVSERVDQVAHKVGS
jgi:uncharacterized protein YukE